MTTLAPREPIPRVYGGCDYGNAGWCVARTLDANGCVLFWIPAHREWKNRIIGYAQGAATLYLQGRDRTTWGAQRLGDGRLTRALLDAHRTAIDAAFGAGTTAQLDPKRTLVVGRTTP